jgi:hypothetical protein
MVSSPVGWWKGARGQRLMVWVNETLSQGPFSKWGGLHEIEDAAALGPLAEPLPAGAVEVVTKFLYTSRSFDKTCLIGGRGPRR